MGLLVLHTLAWLRPAGPFREIGCSLGTHIWAGGPGDNLEACLGVEALGSSGKKHRTLGLGREIPGDGRMWKVVLPTITLRKEGKTVVFFVGGPRAPVQVLTGVRPALQKPGTIIHCSDGAYSHFPKFHS